MGQVPQVGVGAFDGDGGEAGVEHEPVGGGAFELLGGLPVGAGVCQGAPVPEFSELGLFGLGEDAVAMEWATPCFQPSSRAWLTVVPSP